MSLIPFAYSIKLKKLVGVNEVISGLACACLCPSCNMKLLARKGQINEHHFSHFNNAEHDCNYSYWVSVKDMAKQIFEVSRSIKVILNSISALQTSPYSSQSNTIEFFNIKKAQESDYIATTSIGKIKIYLSTPEHTRFSRMEKEGSFTERLILNIDLSKYQNSNKSALEMLVLLETKNKSFLLPIHQLRKQEGEYLDKDNDLEREANKPLDFSQWKQSDEDEIVEKLYLDRRNIQAGMLKTIREMKIFYEESILDCMSMKPSKEFEIVRSNGVIDYISYKESFFAFTRIGIYNIVYLYNNDEFIKIANTTNRENIFYAMDRYLADLFEVDLVF